MPLRILAALLGLLIIAATVLSAVRTFVLPRAAHDPISRFVFRGLRRLFDFRLRFALRRLTMAPRASWIYDGPSIGVTPRDLETSAADG